MTTTTHPEWIQKAAKEAVKYNVALTTENIADAIATAYAKEADRVRVLKEALFRIAKWSKTGIPPYAFTRDDVRAIAREALSAFDEELDMASYSLWQDCCNEEFPTQRWFCVTSDAGGKVGEGQAEDIDEMREWLTWLENNSTDLVDDIAQWRIDEWRALQSAQDP